MENVLIHDMPFVERPRERLLGNGAEALREEELLALVLRSGYAGRSALSIAHDLLATYPLLRLLRMAPADLARQRGMGLSRACALLAAAELARRVDQAQDGTLPRLQSVGDIVAQSIEIRDKKKEHLLAFFLNARHQLIAKEIISIGTLTASLAHPREIFAPAIGRAAAGVIMVHNHPSGDPTPSEEDIRLTQRVKQAGQVLGMELLDHVIVTERGSYSFKTAGQL